MKKCRTYRKIMTKSLSLLLCLLLFFYAIPTVIYAEIADAVKSEPISESSFSSSSEDGEIPGSYTGVAYEVEELREENVKHFRLEDGSYVAAQYNYPVHTLNSDGELVDIDNALTESAGGMLSSPNARVKFAKKTPGNGTLFELHDGNTKLTMYLIGAEKKTEGKVTNGTDDGEDTTLGKMMNLEKLTSSIIYENILDGTDVEYVVSSLNIKENIIVKEKKNDYTYSFELALNGLSAELNESGDVIIYEGDDVKYVIPAPVVFDSNGVHAPEGAAEYILAGGHNGKYVLSVTASREWMNDEERAFPVTIDPTISTGVDWIEDTSISNAAPSTAFGSETTLPITPNRTAFWKTTVLPPVPPSASIISATITMRISNHTYGDYVGVYRVLTDWNESLTYNQHISATNPKGEIDTELVDYSYLTSGYATWDITFLAKGWYDGSIPNYGICFKAPEGMSASLGLTSSENAISAYRPSLLVTYLDFKGVEDYWSYSSQTVGSGGTGSVNLATGQLSFAIPTLTTTDSLMPYSPTLVYNSSLANKLYTGSNAETAITNQHFGFGWKLNAYETFIKKSYTDQSGYPVEYYVYADADGTEHGFYLYDAEHDRYTDEDGMQKTLTVYANGELQLTDDSKITKVFSKLTLSDGTVTDGWFMTRITDESGNDLLFSYDGQTKLVSISLRPNGLSAIEMLKLYYVNNSYIGLIYNPTSGYGFIFKYSGYSLVQADYVRSSATLNDTEIQSFVNSSDENTSLFECISSYQYTYSSGLLTSCIDYSSGQRILYTWGNGNKITSVSHYSDTTLGQTVKLTYGVGYSDVTSSGTDDAINTSDDVITRYVFDNFGRAISVYSMSSDGSEIYGATSGKYETQENVKNNIKEQTTLGGSSVNYLTNGDFEEWTAEEGFATWSTSGEITRTDNRFDNDIGNNTLKISPTMAGPSILSKELVLKAGKYTLSFDYMTRNCFEISGSVYIKNLDNMRTLHWDSISVNTSSDLLVTSVFSTTFEITEEAAIEISMNFYADINTPPTPEIYLDNVSLESSIGSSGFSLVEYGSFYESSNGNMTSYWHEYTSYPTSIYTYDSTFDESLAIYNSLDSAEYVRQRIYEAPEELLANWDNEYNANTDYIVSGFAKAPNASYATKAIFRLRADVVYYQGENQNDVTVSHYYDFLPGIDGWQFISGSLDLDDIPEDQYSQSADYRFVKAIDIYCEYSYQPHGYALFDNISVVNSTCADLTKYTYYSSGAANGLPKQVKNVSYTEYYEYDNNRNLSRIANNRGELTDYTYDENGRPMFEISYSFRYQGDTIYPIDSEAPDSVITKTGKAKSSHQYNEYGQLIRTMTMLIDDEGIYLQETKQIISESTYVNTPGSHIFGALLSETDSLGVTTRYFYDDLTGWLLAVVNANEGTGLTYSYNSRGELINVKPATYSVSTGDYTAVANAENVGYTYNSENLLSAITTRSTTYNFTYDVFGNQSEISVGNNTLAAYEYNDYNGKLKKITYGNGYTEEYVYNDLELLSEVWYNTGSGSNILAYEYLYTASGQVYKVIDNILNKETIHRYDTSGRLVGVVQYDKWDKIQDLSTNVIYNEKGEVWATEHNVSYGDSLSNTYIAEIYKYYTYHTDGRLREATLEQRWAYGTETYTYDLYERVTGISHEYYSGEYGSFTNDISYTYKNTATNTSGVVETYTSTVNGVSTTYTYTYDDRGYITKVVVNNADEIRYYYDDIGQLVREDNEIIGNTFVYLYDNAGNIYEREVCDLTEEGDYPIFCGLFEMGYYDSEWGDLMTYTTGGENTYDAIGNPLSYNSGRDYTFTWRGRRMETAQVSGKTMSFTYNDEGIRTSKTVNGVTTTYYLNGSQILGEETNGNLTIYIYDSNGSPIGMQYHASGYAQDEWDIFWYEKNMQGDIVAVYDESGNKLVSYVYNAWGDDQGVIYSGGASSSHAVAKNPFRYRGYYYDTNLGLYYINSRYYDAFVGRWISADVYISTGQDLTGYNMFAYCGNNPVNRVDPNGHFWKEIGQFITNAAVEILVAAYESVEAYAAIGRGVTVGPELANVEVSQDAYVGIDDGKFVTGNTISANAKAEAPNDVSISFGYTADHRVESGGQRITDSGSAGDGPLDMLFYEDTTHTVYLSWNNWSIDSKFNLRYQFEGSYHQGGGGYVAAGFNFTEFLWRIFN